MISLTSADLDDQIRWSRATFGPGTREAGIIDHIKKELKEIEQANPGDDKISEWVDIVVLGLDGLWRAMDYGENNIAGTAKGYQMIVRYLSKMKVNFERQWPDWRNFKQNQAIEHVRTEGQLIDDLRSEQ